MLTECLNPECRKELHYLRDGKVVRTVRQQEEDVKVEHFWLCGECHVDYDFRFTADGQVTVSRRLGIPGHIPPRTPDKPDLTLVA
jgi:hypothetical protein